MFPLFKNHPVPNGVMDTAFSNGSGTIGKGQFAGQRYTVSAAGQPVHGLNIGGVVLNTMDFSTPVEYVVSFRTGIGSTEPAWNGVEWINIERYSTNTQISGFRSGDVNILRVPGFSALRTASSIDTQSYLAWKNYALLSGRERYTFGKNLKKDSWLCSFGVGRTYKLKFLGSTGSTAANRTFSFSAKLYGQFGAASRPVQLLGVEGPRDYQSNTDAAILPTGIPPNFRGLERFRVEDFTTTGQKVIVSAYLAPNIDGGIEDDGVSDMCTAPLGWYQFTFTEVGDDLAVTYEVLANYQETSSAKSVGFTNLVPLLPSMSATNKYTRVGVIAAPIPSGAPPTYVENYNPYKITYFDNGSGFPTGIEVIEGIFPTGTVRGEVASLIGEIGKHYGGSPGTRIRRTRMLHMCYDSSNAVVVASISYLRYQHNNLKKLVSLTAHSDYLRMPRANPVTAAGSAYAEYEIETIAQYDLFDFDLIVGGTSVASFKVESKADAYTEKGKKWLVVASGDLPPTTVDTSPTETKQSVVPAVNTGSLSIGGALDAHCGWQIDAPFRDTALPSEHLDAWIRPFVRVDSNKLMSFVIAREGYSAVFEDKPAGNNLLFPLVTPSLLSGNHFYKSTYDLYNKRLLVNTSAHGNAANPATNIAGSKYVCSLNPATGEAVLNGESACTWV